MSFVLVLIVLFVLFRLCMCRVYCLVLLSHSSACDNRNQLFRRARHKTHIYRDRDVRVCLTVALVVYDVSLLICASIEFAVFLHFCMSVWG